jgi:hypothetical protein
MKFSTSTVLVISTLSGFSQAFPTHKHSSYLNKRANFHPIIKPRTFSTINNDSIFKDVASDSFLKSKSRKRDLVIKISLNFLLYTAVKRTSRDDSDDDDSMDGSTGGKHYSGNSNFSVDQSSRSSNENFIVHNWFTNKLLLDNSAQSQSKKKGKGCDKNSSSSSGKKVIFF